MSNRGHQPPLRRGKSGEEEEGDPRSRSVSDPRLTGNPRSGTSDTGHVRTPVCCQGDGWGCPSRKFEEREGTPLSFPEVGKGPPLLMSPECRRKISSLVELLEVDGRTEEVGSSTHSDSRPCAPGTCTSTWTTSDISATTVVS